MKLSECVDQLLNQAGTFLVSQSLVSLASISGRRLAYCETAFSPESYFLLPMELCRPPRRPNPTTPDRTKSPMSIASDGEHAIICSALTSCLGDFCFPKEP